MSLRVVVRAGALALVLFLAAIPGERARADGGEAGLVIDDGGVVQTFCVPFTGDSIGADEMLARARVAVEDVSGAVCAIGPTDGCFAAQTFADCFCQCPGGSNCTYWAFFTKQYGGAWKLSGTGLRSTPAHNGDLQGWRWGKGSFTSAPPPPDVSFEQVCGHPPGAALTATARPTETVANPPATSQTEPAAAAPSSPSATGPAAPVVTTTAAPTVTIELPSATIAEDVTPLPPDAGSSPSVAPAEITIINHGTDTAPTNLSERHGSGGGRSTAPLIAFAAIAAVLVAAIAAALVWRRRRG